MVDCAVRAFRDDACSAIVAAFCLSLVVAPIDIAVVQSAAGTRALWPAISVGIHTMMRQPIVYAQTPEVRAPTAPHAHTL